MHAQAAQAGTDRNQTHTQARTQLPTCAVPWPHWPTGLAGDRGAEGQDVTVVRAEDDAVAVGFVSAVFVVIVTTLQPAPPSQPPIYQLLSLTPSLSCLVSPASLASLASLTGVGVDGGCPCCQRQMLIVSLHSCSARFQDGSQPSSHLGVSSLCASSHSSSLEHRPRTYARGDGAHNCISFVGFLCRSGATRPKAFIAPIVL